MALYLAALLIVAALVALATLTWQRSGGTPAARLFVAICATLTLVCAVTYGQAIFRSPDDLYVVRAGLLALLAIFTPLMTALLSALFAPGWWQGRRPICWIMLPYALCAALVLADLGGRLGLFTTGMLLQGERSSFVVTPAGRVMMGLFSASWLVPLAMLVGVFVRQPQQRAPIGVLAGALALTIAAVVVTNSLRLPPVVSGLASILPLPLALAYAVLRTRLLAPISAATDLALQTMSDAALVLSPAGRVLFRNQRAAALGLPAEGADATALTSAAGGSLDAGGRHLLISSAPLRDRDGRELGALLMGRDMTDLEERSEQLERERAQLTDAVRELEARELERDQLADTVRALSVPAIPVLDGVLVMPLVGALDARRAADLQQRMLAMIEAQRARLALIDITGLPLLDRDAARALIDAMRSARLLGARCMLVGVRPEIAQELVAQGMTVDQIPTAATLQEALSAELRSRPSPAA